MKEIVAGLDGPLGCDVLLFGYAVRHKANKWLWSFHRLVALFPH